MFPTTRILELMITITSLLGPWFDKTTGEMCVGTDEFEPEVLLMFGKYRGLRFLET